MRTGMYADAQLQLLLGSVGDLEGLHGAEQVQRHRSDLARVLVAVALGQARHHHVRVTCCCRTAQYSKVSYCGNN